MRRVARRAAALAARHARGLAAPAEGALADTSAFTRFTSPVPTAFNHTGILGAPPTKARGGALLRRGRARARARAASARASGPVVCSPAFWPAACARRRCADAWRRADATRR
jgi:hypothetical protein